MSQRPWYYVAGRKDLTEQLIARKREEEARLREKHAEADNYFSRCSFETKLHKQWSEDRPMQRISHSPAGVRKAPFDMDYEAMRDKSVLKNIENERNDAKKQLEELFTKYSECEKEVNECKAVGEMLLSKIIYVLEVNSKLKEKEDEWSLRENRFKYIRFGCDRLKHKGFLICEKLFYYKVLLENTFDKSIYEFLTEEEIAELEAVIEGGKKIIEMYVNINYKRNTLFTTLYQEEAEIRWQTQTQEWDREYQVWECLVTQIMEVYFDLLKNKIENNVCRQEQSLVSKEEAFNQIKQLIDKIEENVYLRVLLDTNVEEYTSQSVN